MTFIRPLIRPLIRPATRSLAQRGSGLLPPSANMVAWYRMGRGQTLVESGLDQPVFLSAWADQSGAGSRDYAQASASAQPTAPGDGTALYDGTSDIMKTPAFTLPQPYTRYLRLKQKTWTTGDYVVDGITDNTSVIMQTGSTPSLSMYGGAGPVAANTAAPLDTWVSVGAVFNGASSVLQIGSTTTTGSAGTAAAGGLTQAGGGSNAGQWANVQIAEEIVYNVAHDATQRAAVIAYLDRVNPPTLPVSVAYRAFGDSITAGFGVTTAWPTLLAASPNVSITTNHAVSGNQAIDTCDTVYANAAQPSLILIGTNDQRTGGYGSDAAKLAHWRQFMRGMFAWIAMPTKTTGQGSTNTSGTWANTAAYGGSVGVQSSVSGSQRTFSVTGDIAYIWTVIQDGQTGTWKVTEGGVTKATGTTAPNATIASINVRSFGVVGTRIPGLGPGAHTLVFETTNAGLSYFIGAAGIGNQSTFNAVYSGNVISPNATGLGTFGVNEANILTYGSAHAAEVAAALADGMPVYQVDTHALTVSYQADGLHPDQTGQQQIADKFKSTMGV